MSGGGTAAWWQNTATGEIHRGFASGDGIATNEACNHDAAEEAGHAEPIEEGVALDALALEPSRACGHCLRDHAAGGVEVAGNQRAPEDEEGVTE